MTQSVTPPLDTQQLRRPRMSRLEKGKTSVIKQIEKTGNFDEMDVLAAKAVESELRRGNGKLGLAYLQAKGRLTPASNTSDLSLSAAVQVLVRGDMIVQAVPTNGQLAPQPALAEADASVAIDIPSDEVVTTSIDITPSTPSTAVSTSTADGTGTDPSGREGPPDNLSLNVRVDNFSKSGSEGDE